jgi:hypothetical protein
LSVLFAGFGVGSFAPIGFSIGGLCRFALGAITISLVSDLETDDTLIRTPTRHSSIAVKLGNILDNMALGTTFGFHHLPFRL